MINFDRPIILANYIIKNNATIRKTATKFNIGKSTVHLDVSKRLKKIDYGLYLKTKKVLEINFLERNVRGGEATKQKYLKIRKAKKEGLK